MRKLAKWVNRGQLGWFFWICVIYAATLVATALAHRNAHSPYQITEGFLLFAGIFLAGDLARRNAGKIKPADRGEMGPDQMSRLRHDLRTPLNSVIGFAALLRDPRFGALEPKQEKFLAHLERGAHSMIALIEATSELNRHQNIEEDVGLQEPRAGGVSR